jgi:hypothetical protein
MIRCNTEYISIRGFHTDQSLEEYVVDESIVNESCDGVEIVVTLDTEIYVLPMPNLTATESNSDLIHVVPETCPLNLSILQETVVKKSTPHAELDVSKCTRPKRSVFNFISSMRMEQANHLLALSISTSVKGKMSKPVTENVVKKSLLKRSYVKPTTQSVNTDLM